jgi:FtsH-binding integral membrane protein
MDPLLLLYKNLHLIGVFMIFVALGGLILHQINAATREQVWRRPVAITHGIGMVLVLVGGFGMLARLRIFWPWPGWVIGKIIIWLVLGVLVAVIGRSPTLAKPLWWITIALGAIAAYLALNQPF